MLDRELLALDLDSEEIARQVIPRVLPMLLDLRGQIVIEPLHELHTRLDRLVDPFEDVMHEPPEELLILGRETEHAGNHVHRNALRVLHRRVHHRLARRDLAHSVEQLAAQPPNLGFPGRDHLRRERREEQPSSDVVEGRIARDGGRRTNRCVDEWAPRVHNDPLGGEVIGVVGDLVHHLVGEGSPQAAVAVAVRDRAT